MLKRVVLSAFLCVFSFNVFAQHANSLEFSPVLGLNAFSANKNKIEGHIYGGEIAYHINQENNLSDWIRVLHVKDVAVVASYRTLKNIQIINTSYPPKIMGDVYGLASRLNISLVKYRNTEFLFTPSLGLVYSTESYFTNQNPLVGSHVNFLLQAGLKLKQNINTSTALIGGIDVFHYSNAATRVPNSGINMINASLGVVKNINIAGINAKPDSLVYDKHSVELSADIGARGVYQSKDKLLKSGFYTGYTYRINSVFGVKAGFDGVYYYSVYDANRNSETFQHTATSYDKWRYGLSIGADLWLNKFVVSANYGRYFHFNGIYPVKYYWTPGLKYYILPNLAFQSKVYLHQADADYLGLGLLVRTKL